MVWIWSRFPMDRQTQQLMHTNHGHVVYCSCSPQMPVEILLYYPGRAWIVIRDLGLRRKTEWTWLPLGQLLTDIRKGEKDQGKGGAGMA